MSPQPRYTYPHTIDNGGGERLTFMRVVDGPNGKRVEVENTVLPGAGPPMHVHHRQDEVLTVQEGRIGYQREGEAPQFAGPGETVAFKRGEMHRFWNAGEGDLKCTGYIEPPDNIEYFLTEIFASTRANGGARPGPLDAAYLTQRYRTEFAMGGIPPLVQRVVFPVMVQVGRVLGTHAKYADSPEPMGR